MIRKLAMIAAVFLNIPELAPAQSIGARELKVAVPIKGMPSTATTADIHYLAGEVGARESYTLSTRGEASITLFGPDGSEIISSSGSGTVELEAVLPFTDVFTVAVARRSPAQAYTLNRKTTVPTLMEARIATGVGYEWKGGPFTQCWVVPGVKLRTADPEQTVEYTLSADRRSVTYFARHMKSPRTVSGEASVTYDGSQVTELYRDHNGGMREERYPLEVNYDPQAFGRVAGYLCKG